MKLVLLDKQTGQVTNVIPETSQEYQTNMDDISLMTTHYRIVVQDTFDPEKLKVNFDPITNQYVLDTSPLPPPAAINSTVL